MKRKMPISDDVIADIYAKIALLDRYKIPVQDLRLSTNEVAAVTGLSPQTICMYASNGYIPCEKYPGRNVYSFKEVCRWMKSHHNDAVILSTSAFNGYQKVRRGGKPGKKAKGEKAI